MCKHTHTQWPGCNGLMTCLHSLLLVEFGRLNGEHGSTPHVECMSQYMRTRPPTPSCSNGVQAPRTPHSFAGRRSVPSKIRPATGGRRALERVEPSSVAGVAVAADRRPDRQDAHGRVDVCMLSTPCQLTAAVAFSTGGCSCKPRVTSQL